MLLNKIKVGQRPTAVAVVAGGGCLDFYAPNFEEVEGAYWFGPVRPSVCP